MTEAEVMEYSTVQYDTTDDEEEDEDEILTDDEEAEDAGRDWRWERLMNCILITDIEYCCQFWSDDFD